ncbi:Oidioi.mRNA.OKI2018_I69.XSR.g14287.t1.cds [Oikopleura dioica]|uniref:Oidioi.mRNA.OKI2018_I69.XSR.g14287.t1.cds n=1 Tax=Oikopleura dioica TaxID=34765 RepID=A0ABN7SDE3_OIKDI|nr:Oidioi.mRNA.OKI2018_I69.XSR.g14287.t1.cds [Oikopleura dioica]
MSKFSKTTKKVKRQYRTRITAPRSEPYNKVVQICQNLDSTGNLQVECRENEHLHCELCRDKTRQFKSRAAVVRHINKTHEPKCPNCRIPLKSWKKVSDHQPYCVCRPAIELRHGVTYFVLTDLVRLCQDDDCFHTPLQHGDLVSLLTLLEN